MTTMCLHYAIVLLLIDTTGSFGVQPISINTEKSSLRVDERFLSIAIDTNLLRHGWQGFVLDERLLALAKGLQPAYLRIGGTSADYLIYNSNDILVVKKSNDVLGTDIFYGTPMKNFTITSSDLDKIHSLAANAGWDVVFDLNVLLRKSDNSWDPTNPLKIMKYARDHGYNFIWQLGNEPNHFNKALYNITASQLAKDFILLRKILEDDPSLGKVIVGPDADALEDQPSRDFLERFLDSGGSVVNGVTWHHYYVNGRTSTIKDFYNATILDGLLTQLNEVSDIVLSRTSQGTRPWMGETSSAFGGGAPGISDRYAAGFMWLDKLGLAARVNQDIVIRQTFYGGRYALLDLDMNPNPDYWLSFVYKRLVGPEVLNIEHGLDIGRVLRVYAHCTNYVLSDYRPGAITVIAMNIDPSKERTFGLKGGLEGMNVDQYLLTPFNGNLTSQYVTLNGKLLRLVDHNTLPTLEAKSISSDNISLPPLSMGFFVVPGAKAGACAMKVAA